MQWRRTPQPYRLSFAAGFERLSYPTARQPITLSAVRCRQVFDRLSIQSSAARRDPPTSNGFGSTIAQHSAPSDAAPRRALLFDLDGTLVDSLPDLAGALNALRGELGLPPLGCEDVASMVGDGVANLVERGLPTAAMPGMAEPEPMVARFLALYESRLTAETVAYPGVLETLTDLRTEGWRCAVCTNKPEAASRRILAELGLAPLFDTVAGGDSFAERKPAAGHILGTLARMGATSEAAVMVGDSRNDLLAARNAGLPAILVSYGYAREPASALGADLVIDRFAELPVALERLTRGSSASRQPASRPPS